MTSHPNLPTARPGSRSVVTDPEGNRDREGCYTFNAFPPVDRSVRHLSVAAIRIGDHAHIEVASAWSHPHEKLPERSVEHRGVAGRLLMAWGHWLNWRAQLDADGVSRIAEVECPTRAMLLSYAVDTPVPLDPAPILAEDADAAREEDARAEEAASHGMIDAEEGDR